MSIPSVPIGHFCIRADRAASGAILREVADALLARGKVSALERAEVGET